MNKSVNHVQIGLMGLFKNLFGKKSKESQTGETGKYMPNAKLHHDELFAINFKENGGKFLYCETINEVYENFNNILKENDWQNENALIFDKKLYDLFKNFDIKSNKETNKVSYFFSRCEALIANEGSVLICSKQIGEKKLKNLPQNFILYATTSQFAENISEGLKRIKTNYSSIPTNITTIKNFNITNDNNFLNYGSSSKNLYLLLLEDL